MRRFVTWLVLALALVWSGPQNAALTISNLSGFNAGGAQSFPVIQTTATSKEDTSSTSHTITLPSSIAAGDLIVIVVSIRNGRTLTTPTGYTQLYKAGEGGGAITHAVYYKSAAGGETTATLAVAVGASGAHVSYRISGWSAIGGSINASGVNPPSLSPSGGLSRYLWIATGGNIDGGSTLGTAPTGFGSKLEIADSSNTACATASLSSEAATVDPDSWGTAGASSFAGTFAVRGL